MKITLIQKSYGQILMRIEVDTGCTKIDISSAFSPFKEMYTWLGRIKDRQLPAEMIIDEEGYGVVLIAKEIADVLEANSRSVEASIDKALSDKSSTPLEAATNTPESIKVMVIR